MSECVTRCVQCPHSLHWRFENALNPLNLLSSDIQSLDNERLSDAHSFTLKYSIPTGVIWLLLQWSRDTPALYPFIVWCVRQNIIIHDSVMTEINSVNVMVARILFR